MLKKALFITAYNRPNYFRETLDSWRKARGFYDWKVFIRLEPSELLNEIVDAALELEHPDLQIITNPSNYGVLHHPWVGFNELFRLDYDFVVRAEDDLVVSEDILEYFEWAAEHYRKDSEIASIVAYSANTLGDESEVERTDMFSPWVWGTWYDRWEDFIRDTWDHNYSTFNGYPGNQAGWDWNLKTRLLPARGLKVIAPVASRSQNIGVFGVHGTPENFETSPSFSYVRPQVEYKER